MRHRYHKFFDDGKPLSSQRIRVISSSTDRTITSAEALIAGLLPPEGTDRVWNSSLGSQWIPFPVYARPSVHDSLLLNFKDDCPKFSVLRKDIANIPIAKKFQATMPVSLRHELAQFLSGNHSYTVCSILGFRRKDESSNGLNYV